LRSTKENASLLRGSPVSASESSEGFLEFLSNRAGSYDGTFSLRKGFCLVRHKILSSSRTSSEHRVLADVLLKNFVAAAVFSVSYFLNVVEEFRSYLSKHFWVSLSKLLLFMLLFIYFVFLI